MPFAFESKVYVLVRRDLPWSVRCVQAVHAVMNLQHRLGLGVPMGARDIGPSVILLGINDEVELSEWEECLHVVDKYNTASFREPDMNDALTAVAYYGLPLPEFSGLRLM